MENQLVTILRITKPQVGSFVKNRFEQEGIECFFTNEGMTMGSAYNPNEILLKVKTSKSEKAIRLLLQIHKEHDLDSIEEDSSYAQMKKILFPVKIGENSLQLCKYAISVAQKNNAEIKLLYVYEDPIIHESAKHTASWEKHVKMELQDAHRKAQQKLVGFSLEIKKEIPEGLLKSVNLHYRMLKGIPKHVITDAAKRYKPDVIFMGSSGKYKTATEFQGKTIAKVIDGTDFPVLVVPPRAAFTDKEKINIVYATDFYDSDNSSLNKLLGVFQAYEKQIYCVHINSNNSPHLQEKVGELNKMLAGAYSAHNIKCILIESDNVVNGIKSFAKENAIDIISFSKIKRPAFYKIFHSSLFDRIISLEGIPMLIFPV